MEPRTEGRDAGDPDPACERAWEGIRAFVAGDLGREGDRVLREHLERCGTCRDAYRGAVMTAAHIGRERRRERSERERVARRARLRRLAFEELPPGRGAPARLRTLVYPALFVLMLVVATRLPARAELVWLAGEVHAGEAALDRSGPRAEVERGTWCAVLPGGSARLAAPDVELVLEGGTELWIERSRPLRVRLARGVLALRGRCEVSTALGVLESADADLALRYDASGLALATERGDATFTGPGGPRRLVAGETFEVPAL